MPSAGLQIFGAGLQLQQVTPGVTNIGNANINGRMITGGLDTRNIPNVFSATPGLYGDYVVLGRQFNNVRNPGFIGSRTVVIGTNMTDGTTLVDGVGRNVSIGWQNFAYKNNGVAIGYATTLGKNDAGSQEGCIAIGSQAGALGEGNIAIGQNASANATRATLICHVVNGNIAGTDLIVIGSNVQAAGRTNFTYINTEAATYNATAADDNSIKIGNSLQTKVTLGPYVISSGMSVPAFVQTANVTITNTAAETTGVGAGTGSANLAAGRLKQGTNVRIRVRGIIADTATPTLQLRIKIGPNTFCDTGAIALTALAGTHGFCVDADITIRTAGAGGTAIGSAIMNINSGTLIDMDTTNIATTAIDTTVANAVDVTFQWGTAAPGNTLTVTHLTVETIG